MANKIEMWQARDGRTFKTGEEADQYETYLDLRDDLVNCCWERDISPDEVAEWIFCNYTLMQRLQPIILKKGD